ncbi:MAG: hypothetical protein ACREVL_07255 [Solimonas sp.]
MHVNGTARLLLAGVCSALLASCNGVGDGAKPERLEIVKTNALLGAGAKADTAFVCFPEPLVLVMHFDNGNFDTSFASRARWTSSNTQVARVSNGDIFIPGSDTLVYDNGVLVPGKAGTATLTAKFSDLTATFVVTIAEPQSFTIEPTSLSMAKHSGSSLVVKAKLLGYERDVTALGEWSFTNSDDDTPDDPDDNSPDDIARIGTTNGIVAAGKTLGSRIAQVKYAACPAGPIADQVAALKSTVNVRDLKTLTLTGEYPAGQAINLMTVPGTETKVATSQAMTVTGGFGDGVTETQDLSGQVTLKSSDATIALPSATNILAVKAGAVTVTATYPAIGADDKPIFTDVGPVNSGTVAVTVGERTQASVSVTPSTEQTITALDSLQYHAVAKFTDNTTQDVTRHVSWASSNGAVIVVGNGALAGGLAVSAKIPEDDVEDDDSADITMLSGRGDTAAKVVVKLKVQPRP